MSNALDNAIQAVKSLDAGIEKFYEKHGFKRTGVFEGEDEYFLRLVKKNGDSSEEEIQ